MSDREAAGRLILHILKLHGLLTAAGDELVAPVGLTSARWQVLGAIERSPHLLPVAQIARNLGLSRQAVQRIVNDLEREGFVAFHENPAHQRAQLIALTPQGDNAYRESMQLRREWVSQLTADIPDEEMNSASDVLAKLRRALEN